MREDPATLERLTRAGTHPVEYEEGLAVARRIRASRYLGERSRTRCMVFADRFQSARRSTIAV